MIGRCILIVFSTAILSLGTCGNAVCSGRQQEPQKTIVFGTVTPESIAIFSKFSVIYSEAFGRLGYRFRLVSLPGERSLVDANTGVLDGEAARIAYLDSEKYPNLLRVPEPIFVIRNAAYSVDASIKVNGWESLKGKGYKVGFVKSVKSIEEKLPLYVKKENILALNGFEQCLKMLQARRIDIYIAATLMEDSVPMMSPAYKDIKRVGLVEELIIYPWFHKRHRELVIPLAGTLKAMKAEGIFQKSIEEMKHQ